MVEFKSTHPLGDLEALVAQHGGSAGSQAAVKIEIHANLACAQVFASKGNEAKLATKLKIGAEPGQATRLKNYTMLPLAPAQWMAIAQGEDSDTLHAKLNRSVGKLGYVSDQSDSRVCFRVSGPMARDLLSRGCRLDLRDGQFGKDRCAQTVMAQVGVLLHQLDDGPRYELYVYAGFARSFFDWLGHSAEQFEYELAVI